MQLTAIFVDILVGSFVAIFLSFLPLILSGERWRAAQGRMRALYRRCQDECKTPETQHLMRS